MDRPRLALAFSRRALLVGGAALVAGGAVAGALPAGAWAAANVADARELTLKGPEGRAIAVSEWTPRGRRVGTILFSHGAGSAPDQYLAVITPWVAAGWRVLAPLHVDSPRHPGTAQFKGLASWRARLEDMRALSAHIGKERYVAAGHSYGGLVALTLGGAAAIPPAGMTGPLADPKVRAVLAFSPPAPIPVLVTAEGYGKLAAPALIQTGTLDLVPGITDPNADGWKGHLVPYEAAAAGNHRYAMVLEGADHYFGGAICTLTLPGPKQLVQIEQANRVAGLFLKAQGLGNARAGRALDGLLTNDLPVRLLRK